MKLLVIDDAPDAIQSIRIALKSEGITVISEMNCEDALKRLAAEPADAVICDVCMPGKDGLECLRDIRSLWPDMNVIMWSGYSTEAMKRDAQSRGALAFLEKPLDFQELLRLLKGLDGGEEKCPI